MKCHHLPEVTHLSEVLRKEQFAQLQRVFQWNKPFSKGFLGLSTVPLERMPSSEDSCFPTSCWKQFSQLLVLENHSVSRFTNNLWGLFLCKVDLLTSSRLKAAALSVGTHAHALRLLTMRPCDSPRGLHTPGPRFSSLLDPLIALSSDFHHCLPALGPRDTHRLSAVVCVTDLVSLVFS